MGEAAEYRRDGYAYFIELPEPVKAGTTERVTVHYGGTPVEAKRPPWDGGFTWSKDAQGYPFVATSCQGLGASVWWPCKDHMYDEPDSMDIRVTVPDNLIVASNGALISDTDNGATRTFHWNSSYPIATYLVSLAIYPYTRFSHWYTPLGGGDPMEVAYFVFPGNYDAVQETYALPCWSSLAQRKRCPRCLAAVRRMGMGMFTLSAGRDGPV